MTEEEWRPIPSFDGWYEVSTLGRVRSWRTSGRHYLTRASSPRILRPYVNQYQQVLLYPVEGKPVTRRVHALVAEAFHGPRPEGMQVRHLDGNPLNNISDNLRYGTVSENQRDRVRHGTSNRGASRRRLTEDDVLEILRLRTQGLSHSAIADTLKVGRACITHLLTGRTWGKLTGLRLEGVSGSYTQPSAA